VLSPDDIVFGFGSGDISYVFEALCSKSECCPGTTTWPIV